MTESRVRRDRYQTSILDFVPDDAKHLQAKFGATNRRKPEEYLTAAREIETRIVRSRNAVVAVIDQPMPKGVPNDCGEHLRIMFDLTALAFQTNTTRVATFIVAHDGSNRSYPSLGISEGHHDLSHHGGNADKRSKVAKINRFHVAQFAHFLKRVSGQSLRGLET